MGKLIVFSLLGIAGIAHAADYFVSSAGQDTNSGISPDQPWKTVAKVNGRTYAPGDQILFARGSEWRESLVASSSGIAGKPILYGAYGNGAKPKFWGSEVLNSQSFVPVSGSTYRIASQVRVNSVLINHEFLIGVPSVTETQAKPRSWYWENGLLYVNTGDSDPRTDRRLYTICLREDAVNSNAKDHLIFRELAVDETAKLDGGFGFRITSSDDVVVEGCEAYRAGKHHFGAINAARFVGKDLYAAFAMPGQGSGGATAYVAFSDKAAAVDVSEWVNCVWEHAEDTATGGNYLAFYSHGTGLRSLLLENMRSKAGDIGIGTDNSATVIQVKGGDLQDACLAVYADGTLIDGVRINGKFACIDLWGSKITVQNVLITGNNWGFQGYQSAIVNRGTSNTVRFSTVVMDPAAPSFNTCLALVKKGSQTKWYGNIMISTGRVLNLWADGLDATDIVQSDFNFYNTNSTFNDISLEAWRARGFDGNSRSGDPSFMSPSAGDYSLRPDSPAIDAAPMDTALVPAADIAGRARPFGPAADLGAFELVNDGVEPRFEQNGVVNAASLRSGAIAPGEMITIFGTGLGPIDLLKGNVDASGSLATSLGGVQVLFDGIAASLVYVSAGQVNAIVPYALDGKSTTQMRITYRNKPSSAVTLPVVAAVPALFTINSSGTGQAAALNADGAVNSPVTAAARGSIVVFYATGIGQIDPPGIDGQLKFGTLPKPVLRVSVSINGIPATVEYAGAAQDLVSGVIQINARIPDDAMPGAAVPVQLTIGDRQSPDGVTIGIRGPG